MTVGTLFASVIVEPRHEEARSGIWGNVILSPPRFPR